MLREYTKSRSSNKQKKNLIITNRHMRTNYQYAFSSLKNESLLQMILIIS